MDKKSTQEQGDPPPWLDNRGREAYEAFGDRTWPPWPVLPLSERRRWIAAAQPSLAREEALLARMRSKLVEQAPEEVSIHREILAKLVEATKRDPAVRKEREVARRILQQAALRDEQARTDPAFARRQAEGISLCRTCGTRLPCAAVDHSSPDQKKIEQLQAKITNMRGLLAASSKEAATSAAKAALAESDLQYFQSTVMRAAGLPVGTSAAGLLTKLLEKRWTLEEIKAAWLRAQETGRPAWEPSRGAGDLENSWDHVRAALLGEEV
jgi:DNA repair exonuclease SbcCD ATPase subunit